MSNRSRGLIVSLGGLAWLAGVVVLEAALDPGDDSLPVAFPILAGFMGVTVGFGLYGFAEQLERRMARIGLRLVAICAAMLGLGFALALVAEAGFLGFLISYSVGLFVLPFALLWFGLTVLSSRVLPGWAKAVPLTMTSIAVLTFGFHAVARDIWDPPDAVWFTCIGVGWTLLGLGIAGGAQVDHEPSRPGAIG